MIVKAKHWVKYNGEWHGTGETFSIDDADAEEMKQYADAVENEPEPQEAEHAEHVKRGRKRKAEE